MLPKTRSGERAHRERKRKLEIGIIIDEISNILTNNASFSNRNISILEFGSGDGFQIPYLKRLGKVVASDIYTSDGIKKLQDIDFIACEINQTPFDNEQFDVIFSNHVIEHIDDLKSAFQEMKRVGTSSCIYAFSVPTNIWLLLSIPAQYYDKVRTIIRKIANLWSKPTNSSGLNSNNPPPDKHHKANSIFAKFVRLIMPEGHGVTSKFFKCYRDFKIEKWQQLFSNNGFSIIKTKPLLLYGPSEWPIIPILNSKNNLCSSVLFLMNKNL
jgi:SAM-dependent methyltransferase